MSKRQLIIEKSIELFAKKGFDATSIQEITQYCGISKGAFYLSFKSKEELIISIIDHFIAQLSDDIDQVVNSDHRVEHKLFLLYSSIFQFFHKHRTFALIFAMEQIQYVKKEMFESIIAFDQQLTSHLLHLLHELYGDSIDQMKYDLILSVKGFIKIHTEFLLTSAFPADLTILSYSLVDKTNALAKHATIPFMTEEIYKSMPIHTPCSFSMQQVVEKINQLIKDSEYADPLEIDSLTLLQEQLQAKHKNQAILRGMMNNLKQFPRCRLLISQLENLLEQ